MDLPGLTPETPQDIKEPNTEANKLGINQRVKHGREQLGGQTSMQNHTAIGQL